MKNNKYNNWKIIGIISAIWIVVFILLSIARIDNAGGIKFNDVYIEKATQKEAFVNDIYVTSMIQFADKCQGYQSFFRNVDLKGNLKGVSLWCANTSKSFTFYYSDKWRLENDKK